MDRSATHPNRKSTGPTKPPSATRAVLLLLGLSYFSTSGLWIPPEVFWLILAIVAIAYFNQYLSQTAKLVLAATAVLIGQLHRAVSPHWKDLKTAASQLLRDSDCCFYFFCFSLVVVFAVIAVRAQRKNTSSAKADESGLLLLGVAAQRVFRRRVIPWSLMRPRTALCLLAALIVVFFFVDFQHAALPQCSLAEQNLKHVQARLHNWQKQYEACGLKLETKRSVYLPPQSPRELARLDFYRRELERRLTRFLPEYEQLRRRLNTENRRRRVTIPEIHFHEAILEHEIAIDQTQVFAAAIQSTPPEYLDTIPSPEAPVSLWNEIEPVTLSRQLTPETKTRVAASYAEMANASRQARDHLLKRGPPQIAFDADETFATWKVAPHNVSQESRRLLAAALQQRLQTQPWRLDLVWYQLAVRRVDGFSVRVPTPQAWGVLATILLWLFLLVTGPKRWRSARTEWLARFHSTRRSFQQLLRDAFLDRQQRPR